MNNQTLVVFYSHTGTSRRAAQLLASQFGWQTGEVSERHPRVGRAGTFKCVADSLLRRRPAIRYEGPDPQAFGSVVFVAPVWVSRMAGPMRRPRRAVCWAVRRLCRLLSPRGTSKTEVMHRAWLPSAGLSRPPPITGPSCTRPAGRPARCSCLRPRGCRRGSPRCRRGPPASLRSGPASLSAPSCRSSAQNQWRLEPWGPWSPRGRYAPADPAA